MVTGVLDYTSIADCFLDGPLKNRLLGMMPPFFTSHSHWQARWLAGTNNLAKIADFATDHLAI